MSTSSRPRSRPATAGFDTNGDPATIFDYTTNAANPSHLLSTAAGDVAVNAHEDINVNQISGALGIGGIGGLGASVGVVTIKSAVTAESASSNIKSSGTVAIGASSAKTVEGWEVTGGAGLAFGISAAIGIINIGTNSTDPDGQADQNAQAGGTLTSANALAGGAGVNAPSASLGGSTDGITARIVGGTITSGALSVTANGEVETKSRPMGSAFGLTGGVGAAIAYTSIRSIVKAEIAPTLLNTGGITIQANMRNRGGHHASDQESVASGAALNLGLSAALAVTTINNSVVANLGGNVHATSIDVLANDATSARAVTLGDTTSGIYAIGASIATVTKTSDTHSTVMDGATITGGLMTVDATESGSLYAKATGMAGGIQAGSGAAATATDNATVTSEVASTANVTYSTFVLSATATPEVTANALGVTVSALGVGVSLATAKANQNVTAFVDHGATLSGNGISLRATLAVPTSGYSTRADATAGVGGGLVGGTGASAVAETDADVVAYLGPNITLPSGSVVVTSSNNSSQYASSTGITLGALAVGGIASVAKSLGTSHAYIANGLTSPDANRLGVIYVVANGEATNKATVVTGSGGVGAVDAGVATTNDVVWTAAEIKNDGALRRVYAGDIIVSASHTSNFTGTVDGTQVAAVGFSGSFVNNTVNAPVTVNIGDGLRLNSQGDIRLFAYSESFNNWSYAKGGGGGVLNGQAVKVDTSITSATTVNVGASTWLSVNGDPMNFPGLLSIGASNKYTERAYVQMAVGGLFESGGAVDRLSTNITNAVNIGANAVLFSVGQIQIGTNTTADVLGIAKVQMWGLFGGAGAETDLHYNTTQSLNVGTNARIEAYDLIQLNAGRLGDGGIEGTIEVKSYTDVYNNTIIPMTVLARGTAAVSNASTVTINTGAQVLGVGNIKIGAYERTPELDGKGTSHNPYLLIFSSSKSDDNNERSSAVNLVINGTVRAGIHSEQNFSISQAGVVTRVDTSNNALVLVDPTLLHSTYVTAEANNIYYAQGVSYPRAEAQARIAELQAQLAAATTQSQRDRINGSLVPLLARVNSLPVGPVATITFGDLFASGGDINIHGRSLSGTGSLISRGAAAITVNHDSPNYLTMSNIVIGNTQGGHVQFSGGAVAPSGMTVTQGNTTAAPQVTINANYLASQPLTTPLANPPAIILQGVVSNLNGNVAIFNRFGDLAVYNSLDAASVNLNLPNGRMVVDLGWGFFSTGGAPQSMLSGYMVRPMSITELLYYAANMKFNASGQFTNAGAFSAYLYERANPAGGANALQGTYYLGTLNGTQNTCISSSCSGVATPSFPSVSFDVIPTRSLMMTGNYDASRLAAGTPVIRAGQVYISANIIDVNGPIIAGRVDNWSINLNAATTTEIAGFRTRYAQGQGTIFDITTATTSSGGDNLIGARYDAVNNQILLSTVTNGVAGYVYLNGQIVNTTALGNITVNAGYSNVTINNNSGVAIATGTISAGQAIPGIVQIVDRNGGGNLQQAGQTQTTWYVYTPGAAIPSASTQRPAARSTTTVWRRRSDRPRPARPRPMRRAPTPRCNGSTWSG